MIPKVRLIVAGCLFAGWIGYLAYLVSITRNPVLLSRPQFLAAELYVLAELSGDADKYPDRSIRVLKVVWPKDEASQKLAGTDITVDYLQFCKQENGWLGIGEYILPLTRAPDGRYLLTEIPMSPGFHHDAKTHNYLRIYPATMEAGEQLDSLVADFHGR